MMSSVFLTVIDLSGNLLLTFHRLYGVGPPDQKGKSQAAAIIIAMDKSQQGQSLFDCFCLSLQTLPSTLAY